MFVANLDDPIRNHLILALVNYLPYGSKTNRNIGYDQEGKELGADDPFSYAILDVKSAAKADLVAWQAEKRDKSIAFFIFMFQRLIKQKDSVRLAKMQTIPTDDTTVAALTANIHEVTKKITTMEQEALSSHVAGAASDPLESEKKRARLIGASF